MTAFSEVDRFLRGQGRFAAEAEAVPWRMLLALLVLGSVAYGAVMGSFGGRGWQAVYSAMKVPVLLGLSSLICLPNFYVLNALMGLREDFAAACRGVLAAQAAVAAVLCSLAPLTVLCYVSGVDHDQALIANGLLFAVATLAGQLVLNRYYAVLVRRNPRHRQVRYAWTALYVFVAIQLAWVLRPYVGVPSLPTRFLRPDAWSNAYVEVVDTLLRALGWR
jgi:hypothetical protein